MNDLAKTEVASVEVANRDTASDIDASVYGNGT